MAFGFTAPTATASGYTQSCIDAWNSAPASEYCTGVDVGRIGIANDESTIGDCTLVHGTCSMTVDVGSQAAQETYRISIDSERLFDFPDTGDLDLCFADQGSAYEMTLQAGCAASQTDSATAATNGLP